MSEIYKVGMADLKVCKAPEGLTTLGLGSCVGIALRDPVTKVGGLAHIMLPDSTKIKQNSNIYKFADTGIDELIKQISLIGGRKDRLVAKIAGGANMFKFAGTNPNSVTVGESNVLATKEKLQSLKIPILAEDTGNNYGRTVVFYPESGDFLIKSVGKPDKTI